MITAVFGIWWAWIAAALVFGLIEVLSPGFLFLGFALGALVTGVLVGLGVSSSAAVLLAVFSAVSLLCWIGLRFAFRRQSSGAKVITEDINDN